MSTTSIADQPAHWGQGGQFRIDPITGVRERIGPVPAAPGAYADPTTPIAGSLPIAAPVVDAVSNQASAAADGAGSISHQQKKAKNG